jgi:hypothetical protein
MHATWSGMTLSSCSGSTTFPTMWWSWSGRSSWVSIREICHWRSTCTSSRSCLAMLCMRLTLMRRSRVLFFVVLTLSWEPWLELGFTPTSTPWWTGPSPPWRTSRTRWGTRRESLKLRRHILRRRPWSCSSPLSSARRATPRSRTKLLLCRTDHPPSLRKLKDLSRSSR